MNGFGRTVAATRPSVSAYKNYREDTATRLPLRENVAGAASKRSDQLATSYPKPECVFDIKNHTLSINQLSKLIRHPLTKLPREMAEWSVLDH